MIHKAAIAAKKFGPKSSKKFGKNFLLRVSKGLEIIKVLITE